MRGLVLGLLFVLMLAASSSGAQTANNTDCFKIKDNSTGLPVHVVDIETIPGPWFFVGGGMNYDTTIKEGIIILGFKVDKIINPANIQITAEFNDSAGARAQGPIYGAYTYSHQKTDCNACRLDDSWGKGYLYAPMDLEVTEPVKHLVPNKIYNVTFAFPTNTTTDSDREFNYIALSVSEGGQVKQGGVWVYRFSGVEPGKGDSYLPTGIKPQDGHIKLTMFNGNWTVDP